MAINLWGVLKGLLVQEESDRTKQVSLEIDSAATTGTKTTLKASQTANRTIDLPDATDTLVGKATSDVLTNKTIDGDDNTVQDLALGSLKTSLADADKFLQRDGLGDVVSGKDVPSGDVVGNSDTQTLTNKSIDADSNTITNIDNADIKAGASIDATKLADGSVDNTEFQSLNGVTSNIQSQLDAKAELSGATDNRLIKSDGAADIQQSGITVDDLNNVTGVNDLTVDGNLTVNGTTTTLNTTTLDVEDTNITINVGGTDGSAEGAGITVERTGTNGSIVYEDTLSSKFKLGALGSEAEVVTVSTSQTLSNKDMSDSSNNIDGASADTITRLSGNQQVVTIPDTASPDNIVLEDFQQQLTNKDIDGGTASNTSRITIPQNTKANLDGLTRKEGTLVYSNDLDKLFIDDGSTLQEVGSGGVGGINFIDNPDAEVNTDGWAVYDDTNATPSDGTGGSPVAVSLTRTTTLPELIRGGASFKLSKSAADGQGEGASYAFSIDEKDKGNEIYFSMEYKTSANYVSGDVIVYLYDVTNASLIGTLTNADSGELQSHTGNGQLISGSFISSGTSSSYRLIFHVATTNASAYDIFFDNVVVTPKSSGVSTTANEFVLQTIAAEANKTSAFSPSSGTWSAITYDNIVLNGQNSMADGGVLGTIFTAPRTGLYRIEASVGFSGNSNGIRGIRIQKDPGGSPSTISLNQIQPSGSNTVTPSIQSVAQLTAGDVINIQVFQTSGGALALDLVGNTTRFAVVEIPDFTKYSVFGEIDSYKSETPPSVSYSGAAPSGLNASYFEWKQRGTTVTVRLGYHYTSTGTPAFAFVDLSSVSGLPLPTARGTFTASYVGAGGYGNGGSILSEGGVGILANSVYISLNSASVGEWHAEISYTTA